MTPRNNDRIYAVDAQHNIQTMHSGVWTGLVWTTGGCGRPRAASYTANIEATTAPTTTSAAVTAMVLWIILSLVSSVGMWWPWDYQRSSMFPRVRLSRGRLNSQTLDPLEN